MIIFLDTGPLGILTNPNRPSLTAMALTWAAAHGHAGNRIMVPSIADYEIRRELVRLGKTRSVAALDAWNANPLDRYITLSDSALRLAADLWAMARNSGTPTAGSHDLDCDALIAAQAISYQRLFGLADTEIIVASTNVAHLSRFVRADLWQNI